MNIVVMAGGRGSRIGGLEKPLLNICGKEIIKRVLEAASSLSPNIYVAVSPNTPRTRAWCISNNIKVIDTPGKGYPHDIGFITRRTGFPILFLPADTPFITAGLLEYFVEKASTIDTSIVTLMVSRHCFPRQFYSNNPMPVGISLFKDRKGYWANIIMCKYPELLDIDTLEELELAERICIDEVSRR